MKINKGTYNYGFGSSNVNFYSLVNVKLSLLIKEFVRINSTFYLIEKNIIFHFIYKKKKNTQLQIIMLRYNICCNVTEIFHINRKIKVLNIKLKVFVTIIIIFSLFNLLQNLLYKNSLHWKLQNLKMY